MTSCSLPANDAKTREWAVFDSRVFAIFAGISFRMFATVEVARTALTMPNFHRCWLLILTLVAAAPTCAAAPCRIDVVDAENGWPVPLVELRTTHSLRFVSDNAGVIAMDAPELMGVETWFTVKGHGYTVAADGFGYRGVRLTPRAGGRLTLEVERRLPAKRLGRLTGGGLFAESQQLGLETEWRDQGILGCDSVQTARHNGRLFWAWGDTTLAGYPLGLFHMTGATTKLEPLASLKPPVRLRYDYFCDQRGRPRVIAPMPGSGPTWVSGTVSLRDESGAMRLVAAYEKIEPPLAAYETGLCVWDESQEKFLRRRVLWTRSDSAPKPPVYPSGHPVLWTDDAGKEWLLFGDPFPHLRCHATFEAWSDPKQWETLSPQAAVNARAGAAKIKPHRGSIAWNAYRQKWVVIFTQNGGESSALGEIWYAEADAPMGPWESAVKVVTHDNYTFYNPHLHPEFADAGSPILIFEGTYTRTFTNHAAATPRYEYNQILYRLDLDDPALGLGRE